MSKVISLTVEGSLLPPAEDKNKGYANASMRYLTIWLELLMQENIGTDLRLTRVNDLEVSASQIQILFLLKILYILTFAMRGPVRPILKQKEKRTWLEFFQRIITYTTIQIVC